MQAVWIAPYGPGLYQYAVYTSNRVLFTGTKPQCVVYYTNYLAMQRASTTTKHHEGRHNDEHR